MLARLDHIESELEKLGEATLRQLAQDLDMTESTLGSFLRHLLETGRAHKTRNSTRVGKLGVPAVWAPGPGDGMVLPDEDERKVFRVKAWPLHMVRDPYALPLGFFGTAA